MFTMVCQQCGTEFTRKKIQKFCSRLCQAAARTYLSARACVWCHTLFKPTQSTRAFCSLSCRSFAIHNRPEQKTRQRALMKSLHQNPVFREKLIASVNSDKNPLKGPKGDSFRRMGKAALALKGWDQVFTHGNGKPLSLAHMLLWQALGEPWQVHLSISLGPRQSGYPTHYVVDIGRKDLCLAIEADGVYHKQRHWRELDAKKGMKLHEMGWHVLRIPDDAILANIQTVLRNIKYITSQREQATISRSTS